MQTKQQQVTDFLDKQAKAQRRSAAPSNTTNTFMDAVVTVIEFVIIGTPFAIAIAGFCGSFDALVK